MRIKILATTKRNKNIYSDKTVSFVPRRVGSGSSLANILERKQTRKR